MTILPSPTHHPAPRLGDDNSTPNRKRQRSQSMQSDASSSSAKRTVADANLDSTLRSPKSDQLSSLSPADQIDSYMAEQGEDQIQEHIASTSSQPQISPVQKLALVEDGKRRAMRAGETWYLLARDWWKRWRKACSGEIDKEGPVTEKDLGPVNNTLLLDQYGHLQSSLAEGIDVEYVPEEVWKYLVDWYGEPIHPLPRRVIARGMSQQVSIELYPPSFKVFQLATHVSPSSSSKFLMVSMGESIRSLNYQLARFIVPGIQPLRPYRVWRVELRDAEEWNSLYFPVNMLPLSSGTLVEDSDDTLEDKAIQSTDCFVVEFKQGDGWLAQLPLPAPSPPLTFAGLSVPPAPLFHSNEGFFDRMGKPGSISASTPISKTESYRSSFPMDTSWKTTTTQKGKKSIEPGTLGLGNMGNTCFMNSAIQCLAHNQELSDYFLSGLYQEELNPDNPLGMHGAIAEAFGDLLQRIWSAGGFSSSYSPREFKSVLQRFAPQFSGYQQHDSQELVAFLLDGLHEDLNRVLKKPYVEKPDWEGGGDVELVKLAQKSWEGYKLRNDSVIVDLFQGQYQSTLICPECQKVSITFDPFMYLTLPLPIQKKWKRDIYYVPWDLELPHIKVPIEINGNASFRDVRNLVGRWMEAPPENLLTLEIFSGRFYKNLDDTVLCSDMAPTDVIVCFELPFHAQQTRGYKKSPEDPIIVPLYLCDVSASASIRHTYMTHKNTNVFGYPAVIAITPDEACNVDAMYDTVLSRLERWTKHARDLFTWEEGPMTPMHEVPITLNGLIPMDSITEITENGDIVTFDPPEGDIVDEKNLKLDDDDDDDDDEMMDVVLTDMVPKRVGAKRDVFTLRLQSNHKDFGAGSYGHQQKSWESWESRMDEARSGGGTLLREGDALFCEFDENMKAYYFGEDRTWEHALWDSWGTFEHPEYLEMRKAAEGNKKRGLSLGDCLDEFTKEEKLGEDDLWYCPQCKKHQQATKKFDLWKAPDVLVVHLKRFSNNRSLRDKIDVFIDFPVEGLDLSEMVGERAAAKRLVDQGVALEELDLTDGDEPLVYDLFAVDEHMGGLGGGHYRAYALNHAAEKWYHFDDSYVTTAKASDAVNPNAYLLFYRRRSASPLGGKSHHKIQAARSKVKQDETSQDREDVHMDTQLPTPPHESTSYVTDLLAFRDTLLSAKIRQKMAERRHENESSRSAEDPAAAAASPSPELPELEEPQSNDIYMDPLELSARRYDFPEPDSVSGRSSPASDVADAGGGYDDDDAQDTSRRRNDWRQDMFGVYEDDDYGAPEGSSGMVSPTESQGRSDGDVEEEEVTP